MQHEEFKIGNLVSHKNYDTRIGIILSFKTLMKQTESEITFAKVYWFDKKMSGSINCKLLRKIC